MEEKREVEVQSLKKGNFAFIRSQPCRITEVTKKPKASVKGNERIYIVGLHVDTGKKYEDTLLATLRIDEILVTKVWFIRYFHQSRIPNLRIFLLNIIPRSAHRSPNFTKLEFQFPQFEVLQSVHFFSI